MAALRKPRALRRGETIGIAAPGGPVDPEATAAGCARLEAAGFRVKRRDDLVARHGYLAGDDERRIDELRELWCDPEVSAIVCARGGYGCDRILHRLDPAWAREGDKPLLGYSDVTALLLWQARQAGLAGFHGPMLEYGDGLDERSLASALDALTGEGALPQHYEGMGVRAGQGEGHLVGGSLTLVAASVGTAWEVETEGAILLLEEVHESPYRVDRMLQQLRGAGKLDGIVGLGFGDLSTCTDAKYGTAVDDVVAEVAERQGVPCVKALCFGHSPLHLAWPVGGRATIDGDQGEIVVHERGVEVAS